MMMRRRRIATPAPQLAERMVVVTGIAFLLMVSWTESPFRTNALLTSISTIRPTVSSLIAYRKNNQKWTSSLPALLQESDQREKKESSINGSGKKDDDEFALHIGRALDTLRREYPQILTQSPDFSLYDEDVEFCMDLPASPLSAYKSSIHGLPRYKMMWDLLHGFLRLFYHTEQSYLSSVKLCHDRVRGNVVRVQWHAVLFPRWSSSPPQPQGRSATTMSTPCAAFSAATSPPPPSAKCHHIDGISVYELDWQSGKIVQHRIEQMVYTNNAQPALAMEEVMLRRHAKAIVAGGTIPVQSTTKPAATTTVEFQSPLFHPFRPKSLFAMEAEQPTPPSTPASSSAVAASNGSGASEAVVVAKDSVTSSSSSSTSSLFSSGGAATVDMAALEAKNKSRQKFGLKPLTPAEFLQVQKEVLQLAAIQKEKALESSAQRLAQQEAQDSLDEKPANLFDKVFGSVVKNMDTCETNFDCVRPQVCCDYVFAKKCCTSGSLVSSRIPLKYAVIPVYAGGGDPTTPPSPR